MAKLILPVKNILIDIRRRINLDTISLEQDIRNHGLKVPLDVEGPDENNNYYLINGDRRLEAWKNVRINEPIEVKVVRGLTSRLERNKERLQMHLDIKPMPGVDFQILIEDILKESGMSDGDLAKELRRDKRRIRKYKPGSEVPDNVREEVAKVRGSQDMLEVIYALNIDVDFKQRLYKSLLSRKLTGDHATAVKRLVSSSVYGRLNEHQRVRALEEALQQATFTKVEAELVVLSELMRTKPSDHQDKFNTWMSNILNNMGKLEDYLHPDLELLVSPLQKKQLAKAVGEINKAVLWIWKDNKKSDQSSFETELEILRESTDTGYRYIFRNR
ncbi:ParB N-terminal domain-containing protein [Paenibacillus qinlingensis]|uniref:ParB N-terminal domain-containing protein n=1 Tax=Paenibacillus qinlingensis TaxID=1837343 RepID=UPI0015658E04|nr:ParB N-terminal domain-containing protein [Paenibacillus qinlingensis]NQX63739.1 ParB N-terminal domain-containing protein [Paenibacillus qinlingensis]